MLAASFTKEEIDKFANVERPGVGIARELYSIAKDNFSAVSKAQEGNLTTEMEQFAGDEKLRSFLSDNKDKLSSLAFTARNLFDLIKDFGSGGSCRISNADLLTFSCLSQDINRRNFYEGNFQSLRESAGLNAAALAFFGGLIAGLATLATALSKIYLSPAEAIAVGVVGVVGIPLCAAVGGYLFGITQADRYFNNRIQRIDQIIDHLEQCPSFSE